jgi:small subunit ribosomal protein S2
METQTQTAADGAVSVQALLEAGVHFGHQTKRWNPKMKRYIFGERNGIYIIDLDRSLDLLNEACAFVYNQVVAGRQVLFVGTKKQAHETLLDAATRLKQPYVVTRWLGGMLTNNRTIRQSVKRMRALEAMEKEGQFEKLPKKEVATLRHELAKLQRSLSGVADMESMPGAMFVVDIQREANAVREAVRMNIPVVALIDTNCDPEPIAYPIPGNDDAIRSIRLIVAEMSKAIERAQQEYAKVAAENARKRAIEEAEARARTKQADDERKAREREARKAREEAIAKLKAAREAEAAAGADAPAETSEPAPAAETPAPEAPAAEAPETTERPAES